MSSVKHRIEYSIRPTAVPGQFKLFMMLLCGTSSPFKSGNNFFIASQQLPIAFDPVYNPIGLHIEFNPALEYETRENVGGPSFCQVVNPLAMTTRTANAPEKYFSINTVAGPTVTAHIIPLNKEVELFTATFIGQIPPRVKLLSVAWRMAPQIGTSSNAQCQVDTMDNHATEYCKIFNFNPDTSKPINNDTALMYGDEVGHAGSGNGGEAGWVENTYNQFQSISLVTI